MRRHAYVIYDARLLLTVDLDRGVLEAVEVYADSLSHFDTGLSVQPLDGDTWLRLQRRARAIARRDCRLRRPRWAADAAADEE